MKKKWSYSFHPINNNQNTNVLWWRYQAFVSSSVSGVDSNRQQLNTVFRPDIGVLSPLAAPVDVIASVGRTITAGYNRINNKPDAYRPLRVNNTVALNELYALGFDNVDNADLYKKLYAENIIYRSVSGINYKEKLVGLPLVPYVTGNTAASLASINNSNANLDVYGPYYEVPMQGPFTEKYVGGSPHRHQWITGTTGLTRAESYVVSGNDYKNPFVANVNQARSDFYRETTAKRPVNIANVKMTTGAYGTVIGNYSKNYELVLGSRGSINSYFNRNSTLFIPSSLTASPFISGNYDYLNPNAARTKAESAVISRFSAPGGPEVAGTYLDRTTEEYSVYNALPFRNLHVRTFLNSWFTSASLHGYVSGSTTLPSYHKIPMNSFSSSAGRIRRDNYWIQRPIPQSDTNYQWINESITSTSSATGYDFIVSGAITGSYTSQMVYYAADPFNTASNILGYDASAITNYAAFAIASSVNLLQVLNLKRNGPYQHPSFKQIRKGEGIPAKLLRANNIYSFVTGSNVPYTARSSTGVVKTFYPIKSLVSAVEPAITDTKPLELIFDVGGQMKSLTISYYNNLVKFTNSIANNNSYNKDIPYSLVSLVSNDYQQMKMILGDKYMSKDLKLKKVVQKQKLFPKENNRFLNTTRIRNQYAETTAQRDATIHRTFWRDNYADRKRTFATALNSQGMIISGVAALTSERWQGSTQFRTFTSSLWPLDIITGSNELMLGELWSNPNYSTGLEAYNAGFWNPAMSYKTPAASQYVFSSVSMISKLGWQWTFMPPNSTSSYQIDITASFSAFNYDKGNLFTQAGINPSYDSYVEYSKQFKVLSKDMSILPEYRISEQMPMFATGNVFNFNTTDNSSFLTLDGADITNSSQNNFFKVYSQAEFIRNIADIKTDLDVKESKIKLKFKGIKKLLPYNGFYPSTRMVQMASLFSSSFGGHFSGTVSEAMTYTDLVSPIIYLGDISSNVLGYNAFLNSLYSPGIAFNTIKSGIANTNRQYFSASFALIAPTLGGQDSIIKQKFETIIEPDTYLSTGAYLFDLDNIGTHDIYSTYNSVDFGGYIRAQWDGKQNNKLYQLSSHNFFGESVRFFLKNGNLNTFISQPESQFSTLISGATYYMDVVIRASSWDFMMYNNKNFNPTNTSSLPYTGSTTYEYQIPATYITNSLSYRGIAFSNGPQMFGQIPNIDPYFANTPCYFYGDSVVRLSFTPSETRKYAASEIISGLNYKSFNKDNFANNNGAISLADSVVYVSGNSGNTIYNKDFLENSNNGVLDSVKIGITKIPKVTFDQRGNAETVQQSNELSGYDAISIATRYETPIFNFSSSIPIGKAGGIWTSYNENQNANEGIYFEIQESFPSYRNSSKTVSQTLTGSLIRVLGFDSKNTSKQLGQLADQKLISEAVVVIPIKKDGTRYELDYTNYNFDEFGLPSLSTFYALKPVSAEPSDSVRKMINTTKKYIMPPHLDFNNNPSVRPFAMYIFEFEHYLDKQDLARIWQNVMPKVAQNHELVSSEIEHELKPGEILQTIDDEVRWIVFKVKRRAEFNYYSVTADTQDDTRFNFNFTVGNSNTSTKNSDLPYSYNWPYDYFSLIEVGQMDAEIELEKKE